ncbi:hypothetical protein [Hymenobacter sp. GOD-10R]|uniref:hypothetical protein n=1 Tax=Hymenobacter sp. GOD-10R TaxID=3093922 RepID=UPI002D78480A|nr:hypothetical protein [Hymenobacter sp. GOD-10R]WRQ29661.1 hypothetical protein SD425_05220 [Hymenobacter sp. GOD-10R]
MRFSYVLSFFLFLFLASSCKDNNEVTPESPLFGVKWQATTSKVNELGSYTFTYKPVKTLMPSFGLEAFQLGRDGSFVRYTFGPADEGLTILGTWTSTDEQTFKVKPTDTKYKEFSLVIESVQDSVVQAHYVF